jgi:hypothetical protein
MPGVQIPRRGSESAKKAAKWLKHQKSNARIKARMADLPLSQNIINRPPPSDLLSWKKTDFSLTKKNFADRERNPSGQFISGVSSNPDDMAMAYKKKVGKIAGAAVLGSGAAMAAMPAGRKLIGRGAQGMLRGAGRVLLR